MSVHCILKEHRMPEGDASQGTGYFSSHQRTSIIYDFKKTSNDDSFEYKTLFVWQVGRVRFCCIWCCLSIP